MYVVLHGSKVRELGEAEGADRATLARRAGISPKTLRRVEGNRGAVSVKTARKVAAALEVEPPQALGRPIGRTHLLSHLHPYHPGPALRFAPISWPARAEEPGGRAPRPPLSPPG
jgi:transcriptional regulator with XRE-family HTH domain